MPGSEDAGFSDNFSDLSYVKPRKPCRCPPWIYNKKEGSLFGRTAKSWFLIFVFYVIFFSSLAAFFMSMMLTFMHFIIPTAVPLRTGNHSLLKLTPALGMRPSPAADKTIISYSPIDPQTYEPYVQNLDAFLNNYYDLNSKNTNSMATCKDGVKTPEDLDRVCTFDLASLGPCTKESKYGYLTKQPCVFLKINKIYGWLPSIKNTSVPHPLVRCQGQNPLDHSNIGKTKYYPSAVLDGVEYGKFDNSYFPYLGQVSYVGPIVAVQFESLRPHTMVLVECDLFNVHTYVSTDKVKFEILVD